MNLEQFCRKILNNLNTKFESDSVVFVKDWINEAVKYICGIKNWWFLRAKQSYSLSEGVKEYSLPENFKKEFLMVLKGDNNYEIIKLASLRDALLYHADEKGKPQHYVINFNNNMISFYPIPNKTYDVDFLYYQFLPKLENATDTNFLLINYPYLVECCAMKYGLEYIGSYEEAEYWNKRTLELIKELNIIDNDIKLPHEMVFVPRRDVNATSFDENIVKTLMDYW